MTGLRAYATTGAALALALAFSCREPTEVTIVITTDVPCDQWKGVTVTVGAPTEIETKAPITTATVCGSVGTLVLVPRGAEDGAFAVKVVGGKGRDPAECVAPFYGPGCIVARRVLAFVPHTPLTIEIPLRDTCSGFRCDASDTCVAGRCRNAKVEPSACTGDRCTEDVLGPPVSTDCATLGRPADASCWDVSAVFTTATYPRDAKNGLHVFGQVVTPGQRVYAFFDGASDQTYTTTQGYCDYQAGTTFVFSPGWDVERSYDPKSGYTVSVRGRSREDCTSFSVSGAALCAGDITVNASRGWRVVKEGSVCSVNGAKKPGDTVDGFGRPVYCNVDPAAGTTKWQAGNHCGGTGGPDCCKCPEAADVDARFGIVRGQP